MYVLMPTGLGQPATPQTITARDSSLVHRVLPAHRCGVRRNRDGTLKIRPATDITHVVIHVLQGRYTSAPQTWHSGASSRSCFPPHYVISKDGEITQVVDEQHIAIHGNNTNSYSIGIEHDGFATDPKYFTEAMYLASAALTRDICRRNNIPVDRAHIIGHDEAPGTTHGDPGGYWDWDYYLALVAWDGRDPQRKPLRIILDYTSLNVWPTSDKWAEVNRLAVRHAPNHQHSYGPKYFRARGDKNAHSADAVVFSAEVPAIGRYNLSAWWPVLSGNNTATKINVSTSSPDPTQASLSAVINQNERRLRTRRTLALPSTPIWYPLGSFLLRANDTVSVQISRRSNSAGWVVADAIRLLKV